jgi:hypothetical protein
MFAIAYGTVVGRKSNFGFWDSENEAAIGLGE